MALRNLVILVVGSLVGTVTLPAHSSCLPGATALCIQQQRFRIELSWEDAAGHAGNGKPVALTSDTGYFWFFHPDNVEVVVKVLDGRALNGHFWVFYGALSNVSFRLTVTDTRSGESKTYANPQGHLASSADTRAFGQRRARLSPERRSRQHPELSRIRPPHRSLERSHGHPGRGPLAGVAAGDRHALYRAGRGRLRRL